MNIYVTDANIFIDLLYGDLLNVMARLGLPIVTTQLVADELSPIQQADLQALVSKNILEIREISL